MDVERPRETCQKLSPLRACSGSFTTRLVGRLCGYGFTMHPGCSVSCTGVDCFGWFAHWDGLYRYTMEDDQAPVAKPTGKT